MSLSNGPMSSSQSGCTQPPKLEVAGRVLFRPARRLHDPVERDEDGAGQLTHRRSRRATAASILATSIFCIVIIASNARLAAALSGLVIASSRTRGVICQEKPHLSLHQPQSLSCAAVVDDRVPVAVGFFLVLGDDHEADRFIGLEIGPAVEADEATGRAR